MAGGYLVKAVHKEMGRPELDGVRRVPTVYLLGAGLNQILKDSEGYTPPLLGNFFQVAWAKDWWHDTGPDVRGVKYKIKYPLVYEYIRRYWKKDVKRLASEPFDLEECFTLLQLQEDEAVAETLSEAAEALRTTRLAVHHDLGGGHSSERGEGLLQILVAHAVGEVTDVKFIAHGRRLSFPE